jgi:DNA-directed RNA polymerase
MVSRKRSRSEANAPAEQPQEEPGILTQLRNCWEFANLMQYIAIFGKVMKIDEDFGIEVRNIVFDIYSGTHYWFLRVSQAS